MPTYDRHCTKCDEIFDVFCKMAEKDEIKPECPYCASIEGEWMLSAPAFSMDPTRFMTTKRDSGFKEVLSKIGERNPRTPVTEQL